MARKGINIPIASDTRAFAKGVESGVIEPLEDVVDVLEDVAREGGDAGDKLEKSMRDAQRATDKLKDEHKELQEAISRGSRTSFRKFEEASDEATDRAKEDIAEFRDEAKQNFSEVASSFTGDMESAVDLIQGTLGGLASSIPGYGLALGALGAGFGAIAAGAIANAEKAKQVVADMYDDLLDSGEKYLSDSYKQEEYWKILKNESDVASLDHVKKIAEATGLTFQQVALAYAGDAELMAVATDKLKAKRLELTKAIAENAAEAEGAAGQELVLVDNLIRKNDARLAQIDETVAMVDAGRAAWDAYGSSATRALQEQRQQQSAAIAGIMTIREAAKQPVMLNVAIDPSDLRRQVSNALTTKDFVAYVNARTNYTGVGKAVY